ncbi:hypothetical protein Q3O60_04035 [Alkalimonas collagenimarina]|uniref:Uncharacterized protein n=1 Tax=Alkalimonas collagenimarina TaxID=400390 RepID=A0ABT9GWB7_9GAMM|nr:hypothetical protein [Alkalimonas collagenimarina]MDP4535356.1 hypothetical protein [Alkalimonas collagenimarina]
MITIKHSQDLALLRRFALAARGFVAGAQAFDIFALGRILAIGQLLYHAG